MTILLGVISDARFPFKGEKDPEAGLKLLSEIRKYDEYIPLIMQSAESENREKAEKAGFRFVDKNSKKDEFRPPSPHGRAHGIW